MQRNIDVYIYIFNTLLFLSQYDNKGRTLLHDIIIRGDLEGLLFLLSVSVNVNSRTSDTAKLTPLHLAVQTGKYQCIQTISNVFAHFNDSEILTISGFLNLKFPVS